MGSFLPVSEGKERGCSQKAVLSGAFLSGDHGTVDAGEVLLLSLADERKAMSTLSSTGPGHEGPGGSGTTL